MQRFNFEATLLSLQFTLRQKYSFGCFLLLFSLPFNTRLVFSKSCQHCSAALSPKTNYFTGQIIALDTSDVQINKLFSSHRGFQTNSVSHHRKTINRSSVMKQRILFTAHRHSELKKTPSVCPGYILVKCLTLCHAIK